MKRHEFWGGVWILGWMFTLGSMTSQPLYLFETFEERLVDAVIALVIWPFLLGAGVGR